MAKFYAIGKLDGVWHIAGAAELDGSRPAFKLRRGRRRTMTPDELAGGDAFPSEGEARAAGATIFPRTYILTVNP